MISRQQLITTFAAAFKRWVAAGRPVRPPSEIERIFLEECRPCEHFRPVGRRSGKCGLCGCHLNISGRMNKLRWATESCPADPPRWRATAGEGAVMEATRLETVEQKEASPPTRRELRRQQRQERRDRRAAAMVRRNGEAGAVEDAVETRKMRRTGRENPPPLVQLPENTDPLVMYDRRKTEIGHALRDWWAPSAGFLVCGGPSLRELDLAPLKERGVASLGVNNVAGYAPVRAFTFSDPPEKFHHGIFLDPAIIKLVPVTKLYKRVRAKREDGTFAFTSFRVADCPSVVAYRRNAVWEPENFLTADAATWGNDKKSAAKNGKPHVLFTFFLGLRLMHYLGCRRVYLLGVDFAMSGTSGYAFDQERTAEAAAGNNQSYRKAAEMCAELRPVLDAAGMEIFNCSPRSRLTVWDHVPYERAVEDCRGLVPKEPLDCKGWYEKQGQKDDDRGTS